MKFTIENHKTWEILFARQVPNLKKFACKEFLIGFEQLSLPKDHIPNLEWLNERIHPVSKWTIVRTPVRYLSDEQWAGHMQRKEFPITNFLRSRAELDFTPEPDIFHDIFGHLPMLMNPQLVTLLDLFSGFYANATKEQLPMIAQFWWNTIEFGLLEENGKVKVFGAGLMSSFGEISHASSKKITTMPFTLDRGIKKPRAVASFHPAFLVNDSVESLRQGLEKFADFLRKESVS